MIHSVKYSKSKKIPIINSKIIIKGVKFFFSHNLQETIQKTLSVIERESRISDYNKSYKIFLKENKLTNTKIKEEIKKIKKLRLQPKISILMPTYNSSHKFLKINIDSVIKQIYKNWELCIADDNSSDSKVRNIIKGYAKKDSRIRYIFRENNGHISRATNSALKIATGEFVALLDHDDVLYPNTISECIKKINKKPNSDLIYTDEDKITTKGIRFEPHFKPDWSPETILSGNYITHFALIRKKIIDKIKGFRIGYEGAQDLDLFLRISDITNKIYHVPQILYSWRTVKTSTASSNSNAKSEYAYQNGTKAIQDCLNRRKLKGTVKIGEGRGLYEYVIENKNKKIDFFILKNKSKYSNNNLVKELQKKFPNSVITTSKKINIGKNIYNFIQKSKSDYIYFLDNQCYLDPETINTSIGFFKIKKIKIVTNKIVNVHKRIYKTGLIITKNNNSVICLDAFCGMTNGGYFNFNYSRMTKNFSATSLIGSAINTKYFQKQKINEIKKLKNLKEIGIFLSSKLNSNRIVYNPIAPIIYKGKFSNDSTSKKVLLFANNIIKKQKYDINYNTNLSTNDNFFNIKH